MNKTLEIYNQTESIKQTALKLGVSEQTVRKQLVNLGAYVSPVSQRIARLAKEGKSVDEMMLILGVSRSTVHSYLPYSKGAYNSENPSANAQRIRKSRSKTQ